MTNLKELERTLVDLAHSKDRLEENYQVGSAYYVEKAIDNLSKIICILRKSLHDN